MKLKFYYNEQIPKYEKYEELLDTMKKMSKDFYKLDDIFKLDFNYHLIKKYENDKKVIIKKMFDEIITCFNILKSIPCAIYLNGSYARGNITAGSDIDLTFFFNKDEISKYQSLIYLIRQSIAVMLNVNIVYVHSFTKNFTTDFRKKNNLVINDQELETKIIWTLTKDQYDIDYPKNRQIPEREICEISSIKDIESLTNLYKEQLEKTHPKEWIYTHKCVLITDNNFSIDSLIIKLDKMYNAEKIKIALNNIKNEIKELIMTTHEYYNELAKSEKIELASFNMIGKRKVSMLVDAFATYLRWYYISNNLNNIPRNLELDELFNYKNNDILDNINKEYCYFRYLISRIEIWAKKYHHYYEHRSKEIINKDIFNKEYKKLWKNDYSPICEQIKSYNRLIEFINSAVLIIK